MDIPTTNSLMLQTLVSSFPNALILLMRYFTVFGTLMLAIKVSEQFRDKNEPFTSLALQCVDDSNPHQRSQKSATTRQACQN